MERYKIAVKNTNESNLVQKLFSELGGVGVKSECKEPIDAQIAYIYLNGRDMFCGLQNEKDKAWFKICREYKELTIPQLKDIVVLARNNPDDLTHKAKSGFRFFVTSDDDIYTYANNQWNSIDVNPFEMAELLPVKEYVNKKTGEYRKTVRTLRGSGWVEIPKWADCYVGYNGASGDWKTFHFGKISFSDRVNEVHENGWESAYNNTLKELVDRKQLIWRRPEQPSTLTDVEGEDQQIQEMAASQLNDIIVLKRNDVGDANAYCHNNGKHYYITSDKKYFLFLHGDLSNKWEESKLDFTYLKEYVKPIKGKEMKEYLEKQEDGTYKLVMRDAVCKVGDIEVPKGSKIYTRGVDNICKFWGDEYHWQTGLPAEILWQRPAQPEVPPLSDNETVLNKQYAEIEQGQQKHNQCFKDVSHLNQVDVYDVLKLFNVTNPCLQDVVKLALSFDGLSVDRQAVELQKMVETLNRAVDLQKY